MVAFESDIHDSWDFWENDFTNYLPSFKNNEEQIEQSLCRSEDQDIFDHSKVHKSECAPLSMGRYMNNATTSKQIYQNGNIDLAHFDQDGNPAIKPKFPMILKFVPNRELL